MQNEEDFNRALVGIVGIFLAILLLIIKGCFKL